MRAGWALLLVLAALPLHADPQAVREALDLELDGRLAEALGRYRDALASEPSLVQDEGATQDLTIRVLSKAANLSIDLGYGEDASDLAARLLASKNTKALQEGTAVRDRLRRLQGKGSTNAPTSAFSQWIADGSASYLPGPADALGISVQETVRIQVGAFKDWANALTLIDMLREKGWAPLTDVKTAPTGEKLHVVYVISRQPAQDKSRLTAQGLLP